MIVSALLCAWWHCNMSIVFSSLSQTILVCAVMNALFVYFLALGTALLWWWSSSLPAWKPGKVTIESLRTTCFVLFKKIFISPLHRYHTLLSNVIWSVLCWQYLLRGGRETIVCPSPGGGVVILLVDVSLYQYTGLPLMEGYNLLPWQHHCIYIYIWAAFFCVVLVTGHIRALSNQSRAILFRQNVFDCNSFLMGN